MTHIIRPCRHCAAPTHGKICRKCFTGKKWRGIVSRARNRKLKSDEANSIKHGGDPERFKSRNSVIKDQESSQRLQQYAEDAERIENIT